MAMENPHNAIFLCTMYSIPMMFPAINQEFLGISKAAVLGFSFINPGPFADLQLPDEVPSAQRHLEGQVGLATRLETWGTWGKIWGENRMEELLILIH